MSAPTIAIASMLTVWPVESEDGYWPTSELHIDRHTGRITQRWFNNETWHHIWEDAVVLNNRHVGNVPDTAQLVLGLFPEEKETT